jgi:hypothetical protein
MGIERYSSFVTGLSVTPPASAGFSVPLLLVDTEDVPLDRRYIITSRSAYATDLTADSDAKNWCAGVWGGSSLNPSMAYIGRWVSTATSPYFVCGSPATFDSSWATGTPITDGTLDIKVGSTTSNVTAIDLTGDTSWADVCDSIEAGTGFPADVTVTVDVLGRIIFTNTAGTGEAQDAISVLSNGAGTDLTDPEYLNIASNSFAVAGMDAEDPDDALAAIKALDDTPFVCSVRGASIAQTVSLAAALPTYKMVGEFVINDTDAKNSGATTDVGYQLEGVANKNVHLIYSEHTTENPDAEVIGAGYPRPEGKWSSAFIGLSASHQSGLDVDGITDKSLTDAEIVALKAKGYDYLDKPSNAVHCCTGLTPSGAEMRHRIAFYWLDKRSSEAAYAYLRSQYEANEVVTFSDGDIQAIGGIVKGYIDTLVERKAIEPDYTLDLPTASEFDAATKATHTLALTDMARMFGQFAVNAISGTMTATV